MLFIESFPPFDMFYFQNHFLVNIPIDATDSTSRKLANSQEWTGNGEEGGNCKKLYPLFSCNVYLVFIFISEIHDTIVKLFACISVQQSYPMIHGCNILAPVPVQDKSKILLLNAAYSCSKCSQGAPLLFYPCKSTCVNSSFSFPVRPMPAYCSLSYVSHPICGAFLFEQCLGCYSGDYGIHIKFGEDHVPDSPQMVHVFPESADAKRVTVQSLRDRGIPVSSLQSAHQFV